MHILKNLQNISGVLDTNNFSCKVAFISKVGPFALMCLAIVAYAQQGSTQMGTTY